MQWVLAEAIYFGSNAMCVHAFQFFIWILCIMHTLQCFAPLLFGLKAAAHFSPQNIFMTVLVSLSQNLEKL